MGNLFIFSYVTAVSHLFIILNVGLLAAGFCICVGSRNARRKKMYIRSRAGEVFSKNGLTQRNLLPCSDYMFSWIFSLLALLGSSLFGMTTVVTLVASSNLHCCCEQFSAAVRNKSYASKCTGNSVRNSYFMILLSVVLVKPVNTWKEWGKHRS